MNLIKRLMWLVIKNKTHPNAGALGYDKDGKPIPGYHLFPGGGGYVWNNPNGRQFRDRQ